MVEVLAVVSVGSGSVAVVSVGSCSVAVVSVGCGSAAVVWTVTAVEVRSELFSLLHYYLSFSPLCNRENEPWRHEKTCSFAYAKTKAQISCPVTTQLIPAFDFAAKIVQSMYFLILKFQTSSHLLYLICVGPRQKPCDVVHMNNKDTDQNTHPQSLISFFVIHSMREPFLYQPRCEKTGLRFPTRSDINRAKQPQKMAIGLKFWK